MREARTRVSIEVRLRRLSAFGGATGSLTAAKGDRITRTAQQHLGAPRREPRCRFGAVPRTGGESRRIDWIRDALAAH